MDDDAHAMHMINATITLGCYKARGVLSLGEIRNSESRAARAPVVQRNSKGGHGGVIGAL